jgi:hypothetical protein
MEGFNPRPTASVPIAECLNGGVHPMQLCQNCAKTHQFSLAVPELMSIAKLASKFSSLA